MLHVLQSKVKEFLELAGSTLDTYMATYDTAEEFPSDTYPPAQFITALTGVITSISSLQSILVL